MFAWLKNLFKSAPKGLDAVAVDVQAARASALSSLDNFYQHMTGDLHALGDQAEEVQKYWMAEFSKVHGYLATLEQKARAAIKAI
jgi:hypothetical protein